MFLIKKNALNHLAQLRSLIPEDQIIRQNRI